MNSAFQLPVDVEEEEEENQRRDEEAPLLLFLSMYTYLFVRGEIKDFI